MERLINLSTQLRKLGFQQESITISKIAQTSELQSWQELLTLIQEPLPSQISTAIDYLKDGAAGMYYNAQKLQNLSEEDLKLLVQLTTKQQNLSATQYEQIIKQAQLETIKNLGTKGLRLMPVIGFMFSFLIALKNFVYGLNSFANLVQDSSQINLNWLEVLFPNKLDEKINEYQNDPEQLKIITQLTKYSKEFSDEGISFIANGLDFIKDIIFLFIDVGSFGWLTVGDVSLSLILMVIENLAESNTLPAFDKLLSKITTISQQHIEKLSSTLDPTFFNPDFKEEESSYDLFK